MTDQRPASALRRLQELDAQRARPTAPAAGGVGPETGGDAPHPRRKGLGGLLVVGALVLWKFKAVLLLVASKAKVLLVGLKLLKFGKLFTTGWTMILSMWVYSLYFGAPFAIGFVLLILVHELGHGLAARLTGLPVSAPVFIPFFGAMIALKELPRTTFQDFVIGYGGPLAGTLGGLACLGLSHVIDGHWGQLLYVLAYFTLVVNMFNLIPVWQLDGARIAAPFRVSMWASAVGILAVVTFGVSGHVEHLNPLALFILLAGAYRLGRMWWLERKAKRAPRSALEQLDSLERDRLEARDESVSQRQRWIAWTCYVVLAGSLITLVHLLQPGLPVVDA